jgi:hypothetical protein
VSLLDSRGTSTKQRSNEASWHRQTSPAAATVTEPAATLIVCESVN